MLSWPGIFLMSHDQVGSSYKALLGFSQFSDIQPILSFYIVDIVPKALKHINHYAIFTGNHHMPTECI
jgi:hypothetical protein